MLQHVDSALQQLEENLSFALGGRPEHQPMLDAFGHDSLVKVTDHVYQSAFGGASTWFVISDSAKALTIDYGYDTLRTPWPNYPYPRHRRSMLHGLSGLRAQFGIERIDVAIVTHFHDDHVCGIPALQRLFGTRCWAGENFAHILSEPMGYSFPCTWPEPIDVKPQPVSKPISWEEYAFTLHPLPGGHTRWGTIIAFEADGTQFAATGDQYFFQDFARPGEARYMHNHVYRNGTMLDSFSRSSALMRRIRPDVILPGHGSAYRTNMAFYQAIEDYAVEYTELHRRTMPLEFHDVHFDVDSRAAWLDPYRTQTDRATLLRYRGHIRNPLGRPADLSVALVGPRAWRGSSITVRADAREEVAAELNILPPQGTTCRRQPIALELTVEGRPFGQVAEALVTIGHPIF
jgi:glyoxylase-like metal-dependent hydrolase (beta-lactamase superfamily II)